MKEERMLNLLGKVDSKYIEEASPMARKSKTVSWVKWCAMAACICLMASGILWGTNFHRLYETEVAYISIDVNPSLELCLNKYGKVIDVSAYNEEGQSVIAALDIKNKSYTEAIRIILENETFATYLRDDADLTFTIVSDKEEEIKAGVEECFKYAENEGRVYCTDSETRHKAKENHCSVGKYLAYEELAQYDKNVTIEDCKHMTMHEIHERIEECESGHHDYEDNSDVNGEHGTHHSEHH